MDPMTIILHIVLGGLGLWLLHKIGQGVTKVLEAAAVIGAAVLAGWLAVKAVWKTARWLVRHWRTTLTATACGLWVYWWGWPPLLITAATLAAGTGLWRWQARQSFDTYIGGRVRSWWLRWAVYARLMPRWLRACGLTINDPGQPVAVQLTAFRRGPVASRPRPRRDQLPRITHVRSGPSWDEVRVRLVAGQTPEDFDAAARALAVARGVTRCQVRELAPDVVSIDFQRHDRLAQLVTSRPLAELADVSGEDIDLRRVWSGRTEYGGDWYQPLAGGHTLTAGATGAGKNSHGWCPIVSIAPAIRDGLVRVSGIDPKGMELAYGRRIFHRYAVTSRDALALLDDLIEGMERRKTEFAGHYRTVPVTREHPAELLEFDEIGALIRYVGDRKTREAIVDRVALLTTQGRALGYTIRGYVQEPTKDTVPVRELFPRRICLRVASKSHVSMVLGDQAYDRGAWANRIGETEAGVGYLFGEGVREPLRVRAGWVDDTTIKELEDFVTGSTAPAIGGTLLALPSSTNGQHPAPGRAVGGAA